MRSPNGRARSVLRSLRRPAVVSVGLLLLGLGGCAGKAQEGAQKPEPIADTAAAQMIGLGNGHVDKFMNYSQTAANTTTAPAPTQVPPGSGVRLKLFF